MTSFQRLGQISLKNCRWFFGKFQDTKRIFRNQLTFKENKTEQEVQIIESWKYVQLDRKEKIEWLKTEATLAQYDLGKTLF